MTSSDRPDRHIPARRRRSGTVGTRPGRTRSAARSRTDAARGFSSTSSGDASSEPRVSSRSRGAP